MKSKTIIVGKAASGKDYLRDRMVARGYRPDISLTTRPMREGEENAKDYYFVSDKEFNQIKSGGGFYESVEFNGWKYGTLLSSWEANDIFIMTPKGISQISKPDREKCFIVYLCINEDVRRDRLKQRSDADKVERRIESDRIDFEGFTDYDLIIQNPDF